ncbi:MAG: ABC transporter ATP-binding protein [Sphaerochaetaceae bacterium]|jgi:putative ABC transport system ATP-binding protein
MPMNMNGRLRIRDLSWSFPGTDEPFLMVPELEIPASSVVALVGPSGSGKSTLLFLLAGLEEGLEGSVAWGEHDVAKMGAKRKEIWRRKHLGLVFQDFQLMPGMSALENVLLPQTFERWSVPFSMRERAMFLMREMGLERRMRADASKLSRGEMQRVAIARALLDEPDVLLADEPTASLDAENEESVARLLLRLAKEDGCTLIVSTHHVALRDQADIVLSLSHGKIVRTSHGTKNQEGRS